MLMKKEVIEDNEKLKEEIKDLKKQLEEEKNAYNRMYNMYVEKDNIINELKWKPIEEYHKGNYDWVLIKMFIKDDSFECIPRVAEKRFNHWYDANGYEIDEDLLEVKYFMDMQQIDKLQELKGSDKE